MRLTAATRRRSERADSASDIRSARADPRRRGQSTLVARVSSSAGSIFGPSSALDGGASATSARPSARLGADLPGGRRPLRRGARAQSGIADRALRLPLAGRRLRAPARRLLGQPPLTGHHHRLRRGRRERRRPIVVNGGYMPIWEPSLVAAGFTPGRRALAAPLRSCRPPLDAQLPAPPRTVRDVIPIPVPIIQNVASIGDCSLPSGLAFFLFASVMRVAGPRWRHRPVQLDVRRRRRLRRTVAPLVGLAGAARLPRTAARRSRAGSGRDRPDGRSDRGLAPRAVAVPRQGPGRALPRRPSPRCRANSRPPSEGPIRPR